MLEKLLRMVINLVREKECPYREKCELYNKDALNCTSEFNARFCGYNKMFSRKEITYVHRKVSTPSVIIPQERVDFSSGVVSPYENFNTSEDT